MYYNSLLLPDLLQMIQEKDENGLHEFCEVFHPANCAEVLESLSPEDFWYVMRCSDKQSRMNAFSFLDLAKQSEFMAFEQDDQTVQVSILEGMAPDDRVDLLSRLDNDRGRQLVSRLSETERNTVRELLAYEEEREDSAGAIMTTEFAWLPQNLTAEEAIARLRRQAHDRETIYYIFILEEERRLRGLVSFRQLLLADPSAKMVDIMQRDVVTVRIEDDREFVASEIAKYDLLAIPVVDNQYRLVGIVTHDDIIDVLQEEATEDAHRQGAVAPLEDSYLTTSILTLVYKRGVWLILLLVAAAFTVNVLKRFEYEMVTQLKHGWLLWFLPLVIASGGNTGSQSATLVIRLLTLEDMRRNETLKLVMREFMLAVLLGSGLGLLTFLIARFFWMDEPTVRAVGEASLMMKSSVVGITVFLVVIMGSVTGATLPLMFKKLGMDPALMSNPLISALVDFFGLIVYYAVASTMLT
ncbi:Magnesium transporter MgtE [Polystyrenella longa]|uniref:Magnesium transporter MgtE n=1 Tax=Polystyrenella longa TaxID=2528007 RepID=A0A518CJT2_9PLAN|nr:magnesium transporter [Polystyrenella longa]QDU79482.1 Magnesium transporter MgtE [Polystyrenella longa]